MNNEVLVLESDNTVARQVVEVVQAGGYTATLAQTTEEALAHYEQRKPWLLIISEQLPDLTEQEWRRTGKGHEFLILLSDKHFPGWQNAAYFGTDPKRPRVIKLRERGAPLDGFSPYPYWPTDMYLQKPFNPRELGQFVRRLRADIEKQSASNDLEPP